MNKKYLIGNVSKFDKTDQRVDFVVADSMKLAIEKMILRDRVVTSISQLEDDIETKDLGWEKADE